MQRLDELEGHLVGEVSSLGKVGGIVDISVGDAGVKVRGTLLRHIKAWEDAGAGAFALGVIKEGFKLSMQFDARSLRRRKQQEFREGLRVRGRRS